ncbi:MAG: phasin family protein [Acidobacteriota bacterium]
MALKSYTDRSLPRAEHGATAALEHTFDTIKDAAYKGLHLGMGLAAMISENIGNFVEDTVKHGEKVERQQLRRLSSIRRDIADVFSFGRSTYQRAQNTVENTIEDAVEEVVEGLDIPKRSEIRRLSRKLNEINKSGALKMHRRRGVKASAARTAGHTATRKATVKTAARTRAKRARK